MPPRPHAVATVEPASATFASLDRRVRAAVETVLTHDPSPLNPYRGLFVTDAEAERLSGAIRLADLDAALTRIAARLGLDPLDSEILALCAAPALSPAHGRLFGYLQDDGARRLASPALLTQLIDDAVLARLAVDAPLRATGAVALLEHPQLLEAPIVVAERVVCELAGVTLREPGWEPRARRVAIPGAFPADERLRGALAQGAPLVAGDDADLALAVTAERPLLVLPIGDLADPATRTDAALAAALEGRLLCATGLDDHDPVELGRWLADLRTFGAIRAYLTPSPRTQALERWFGVRVVVAPATREQREQAWRTQTGREDVTAVAATFRLSLGQIAEAARTVRLDEDLAVAAQRVSGLRLGGLARRLDAPYSWDDLVLGRRERDLLRSVTGYLRHRDLVLGGWGYQRTVAPTQGLKVLFAGESGTGKTMAAQVLARELGLEIHAIDLAMIVSKYIGETEKNLRRIFEAAERSSAILFFDEADALFGRRSEVRDSHDRYANVEVAYLLQQMEAHPGAVILATNLRLNIDQAFLRRLDFVIEFPVPVEADRARLWRRVLPPQAPLADDVDLAFLARQFALAGGGIRNASLAAAFMAAGEQQPIAMAHLIRGVAIEYDKLGRLALESDFGPYHALVRHER